MHPSRSHILLALSVSGFLGAACGSSTAGSNNPSQGTDGGSHDAGSDAQPGLSDAGPASSEDSSLPDATSASPDASKDPTGLDASPPPPDATPVTGMDASDDAPPVPDASAPPNAIILVETSSSAGGLDYEFSNASGQWAWNTLSGAGYKGPFRSTFLASGAAVTLYGSASSGAGELFDTAVWNGGNTWQEGSFVLPDYNASYFDLAGPVATASGAGVVYQEQVLTDAGTIDLFAVYSDFDPTQSAWNPDSALSLAISNTPPAVAATAAGYPLVVVAKNASYSWTLRTGTTWSAPAAVPGISAPLDCPSAPYVTPQIAAIARTGVDEILAVFVACGAQGGYSLASATFSSGAWTTPITFLDSQPWPSVSLSLAALPDGRIALATNAQTTESDGGTVMTCSLGFWDGTSWSAFRTAETERYNVSLVAGVGGAVLELFSTGPDLNSSLFHSRLMDDAAWTWSEGTVDSANVAWSYAAASRP